MRREPTPPVEWEPALDHEPRGDQLSLFDAGEPIPAPAKPGKRAVPVGPSLFDLIPAEDSL